MTPPEITRVFLAEGESDAIALLNAGLECLSPKEGEIGTAIVASPGTSFKAEWAPLFTGKDLIICPDNDTAGDKAATKIADLCRPYTNSTSRVKWNVPTQTKLKIHPKTSATFISKPDQKPKQSSKQISSL